MKPKDKSKYIAGTIKIFMTVMILLIAVGIMQAIIIEVAMLWETPSRATPTKPEKISDQEKQLKKLRNSAKQFLPNGTIHLVHTVEFTPGRMDEPKKEQIYDANATLLWSGLKKDSPYEYLSWTKAYGREDFKEQRLKQLQMITSEFSRSLEIPVRPQEKTEEIWRYDPKLQLFAGYRVKGGKIGYIGSTGFKDSISKAKPFGTFKLFTAWCPQDSFSPTLLWQTSRRVYEINFEKQQTQLIFESPEANIIKISLHKWRPIRLETEQDLKITYRPLIQCMTEDNKFHLVMRNPDQKLTVPIDPDWWIEVLSFTATTEDIFLLRRDNEKRPPAAFYKSPKSYIKSYMQWIKKFEGKPYKQWVELYRVDNQGNLDRLNRYEWTVPARTGPVVKVNSPKKKVKHYACQFSSPLYDLVLYLLASNFRAYSYQGDDFIFVFADLVEELRPGNSILNWLLGLAMTGFAFWHGWPRQTSRAKLIFWLAFTLVFNLAGLLTYLALNHTPIIKCSACGKSRCLDQVNCLRCGTQLPEPKLRNLDLILNT